MNTNDKSFKITSVNKWDLLEEFKNDEEAKKVILKLDDRDMKLLASEMADLYCGCCFWTSLKTVFEDKFLN